MGLTFILALWIAALWTILGIPLGIIFAIVRSNTKDSKGKATYKKLMIWSFAGLGALVVVFLLYFVINVVSALLFGTALH